MTPQGERQSITLVSREAYFPFCPKALVQVTCDNADLTASLIQSEEWYRQHGVSLMLRTNVTFITPSSGF